MILPLLQPCLLLCLACHAAAFRGKAASRAGALRASTAGGAVSKTETSSDTADGAIDKVLRMLQKMLEKSKADAKEEGKVFAELKCYCTSNEKSKTDELKSLDESIALYQSRADELRGIEGGLSVSSARLVQDLRSKEDQIRAAVSLRNTEAGDYANSKNDLKKAVWQLKTAIQVLQEIGADQTLGNSAADHEAAMGDSELQLSVKKAVLAASPLLPPEKAHRLESLLQQPYTARSGEVVGMLKNMQDSFSGELADLEAREKRARTDFDLFMDASRAARDDMSSMLDSKQAKAGSTDEDLSLTLQQLGDAQRAKADAEAFLGEMRPMCKREFKKNKEHRLLRAQEETAITEALAILNKDEAYETFQSAGYAGAAPSLLQLANPKEREADRRAAALKLLQAAAKGAEAGTASTLVRIAAGLEAGKAFPELWKAMDEVLDVLAKEGQQDRKQYSWCQEEYHRSNFDIQKADHRAANLEAHIQAVQTEIEEPQMGLKAQIGYVETALQENLQNQKKETSLREKENAVYQQNLATLERSQELLGSAMEVLARHYNEHLGGLDKMTGGGYRGTRVEGANVLNMLEFIRSSMNRDVQVADHNEKQAQKVYEHNMAQLQRQESETQEYLSTLQQTLAKREQEVLQLTKDLQRTKEQREAVQKYLKDIRPGCDFILKNFNQREKRRFEEKQAIRQARAFIEMLPSVSAAR